MNWSRLLPAAIGVLSLTCASTMSFAQETTEEGESDEMAEAREILR